MGQKRTGFLIPEPLNKRGKKGENKKRAFFSGKIFDDFFHPDRFHALFCFWEVTSQVPGTKFVLKRKEGKKERKILFGSGGIKVRELGAYPWVDRGDLKNIL